ncbi:MAG: hypothetical protein ASARMPREDX12_002394 [Alectoria sarmentosa]|nr:MAG: hypothetical protein ASARMPRED_005659 [Alectoria sarmentosa]CAD6569370.1 MAG: hypothetical protein ASARMPREDX12_002394 [Alectoria sarmentosa]
MPEETRYFTLNGNVPNGGVPPGRMFASVAGLPFGPNPGHQPFSPGPFGGGYGPPPPYHGPQENRNGGGYPPYHPTLHPGTPPPAPRAPSAPASYGSGYEPPGQYIDGHMLHGDGWSYITPSEHTTMHFVGDGTRPCDAPNGYYPRHFNFSKHKVPTMMTVKDLIKRLGAPAGEHNGITEMEELGDDRFTAGVTITQGSEDAKKTLAEMGWTQMKSEAGPIWIVVKR